MRCSKCGKEMDLREEFEFTSEDLHNPDPFIASRYGAAVAAGIDLDGRWHLWVCDDDEVMVVVRVGENATGGPEEGQDG